MEEVNENLINQYPIPFSYDSTKRIIEQMEKNICKVKIGNQQGSGFFCKIPFPNKDNLLPVFITNNHVIDKDILYNDNEKISIIIKDEENVKKISLNNRMKYTSEKYDTTIIEIKDEDNIKNYLELDDIIIDNILNDKNKNIDYIDKTIYLIQYPEGILSVSYGVLINIFEDKKYTFSHKCSTKEGSSGAPVLGLNNKIIGIHKKGTKLFNLGSFLDYPIKEFIQKKCDSKINDKVNDFSSNICYNNEIKLKQLNDKYKLFIKDIYIRKLDLIQIKIGNNGFSQLCNIEFKELKYLDLNNNNISNINVLKNAKFENLEILNLGNNFIEDINAFGDINFKKLKELYLYNNKIFNIKAISNAKIPKLKILSLSDNNISDINVFEKVNFTELKQLYLDNKIENYNIIKETIDSKIKNIYKKNLIADIRVLGNVNFKKLEILSLGNNSISDINILSKVNFPELRCLILKNNEISDISIFEKNKFENLEVLSLGNNKISDICVFSKLHFKSLKKLYLEYNRISNIKPLELAKFSQLERLHIYNNPCWSQYDTLNNLRHKIKDVCFYSG